MLTACCRHASSSTGVSLRVLPRVAVQSQTARITVARVSARCVAVGLGVAIPVGLRMRRAQCMAALAQPAWMEDPWLLVPRKGDVVAVPSSLLTILRLPLTIVQSIFTTTRLTLRCLSLLLLLGPLIAVFPVARRSTRLENAWWKAFIWALQASGPTFTKLGQWLSTRRDVFSKIFCDRLSILHTKTRRQRYFRDCEVTLDEIFGKGFVAKHKNTVFESIEPFSIGSGCIAQVYKATIRVPEFEKATGRQLDKFKGRETVEIAIKVAERGVESQMEQDLTIIRFFARSALTLVPSLKYVDPLGAINQFEMVLRRQVDLSNEAKALERFATNFDAKATGIKFPIVLAYTSNAIIETFEEGIYINKLIADEENPEHQRASDGSDTERLKSRQSPAVRRRIALIGARALLKMIFVDNFVHGDLHPGNILIRFNDSTETLPGVHKAPVQEGIIEKIWDSVASFIRVHRTPRIRFTDSPYTEDEPTLVLIDTGIAISETPNNLKNLKELFRAMVEKKGYDVGELLLTRSTEQDCKDPEQFCRQVEDLVKRAREAGSLRTLNISGLLSQLFSIVAQHRVKLDTSFTTVILSVMVLEGFGRSLDPDLDLFQCARPYLLNVMV